MAQAPAANDDAARLTAARELLRVTDIKGQMHSAMPKIAQAAVQAMLAQMQQQFGKDHIPDAVQQQFGAALQSYMTSLDEAFTPDVLDQMAAVYARHFSAADLSHLSALLADPVMQRFRSETPNMMGEMLPILMTAMKPQQDAFRANMQKIAADWIKQHPEDKAKLSSPAAH